MNNQASSNTPTDNSFPGIIQMALLAESLVFTAPALEQLLKTELKSESISVVGSSLEGSVITWGRMTFTLMTINKPIPAETFDTALRTSHGLRNGAQLISDHKAHLIISPLNAVKDQLQAIYAALSVMTLTDIIANRSKPLGYFWSNSEILQDHDQFAQALAGAEKAMGKFTAKERDPWYDLPVTCWVGMRMISPDRKTKFGAVTQGLAAITGFEIQIEPFQAKPAEVAKHLYGMASYALNHGPMIKDGDTIGISQQQRFRIRRQTGTPTTSPRWLMTVEAV